MHGSINDHGIMDNHVVFGFNAQYDTIEDILTIYLVFMFITLWTLHIQGGVCMQLHGSSYQIHV